MKRSDVVNDLSNRERTGFFLYRHGDEDEADIPFGMKHDILPITKKMLSKYCSEEDFEKERESDSESDEEESEKSKVEKEKEIAYLQKLIERYQEENQRDFYRSIFPTQNIEKYIDKGNEIRKTLQEILKWKVTGER